MILFLALHLPEIPDAVEAQKSDTLQDARKLMEEKDWKGALALLEERKNLEPYNESIRFLYAKTTIHWWILEQKKPENREIRRISADLKWGLQLYTASQIDNGLASARALYLGILYRYTGQLHLAGIYFQESIDLDPQNFYALFNLATLKEEAGAYGEARALYKQIPLSFAIEM